MKRRFEKRGSMCWESKAAILRDVKREPRVGDSGVGPTVWPAKRRFR